jgi:site-specific DNA recombinase
LNNPLGVTNSKNRWGTVYPYFYCIGRAKHRTCTQPAVLIADVEASVADYWTRVQFSEARIAQIREQAMAELARRQNTHRIELERQEKRKRQLHDQQLKLLEARYANAIPLDLLKSEQERITRDLAGAQQIIDRCSTEINLILTVVEEILLLCANAHRLYLSATPDVRRQLNQAVFTRFWIVDDQVHGTDLTEPFAQLLAPDITIPLSTDGDATTNAVTDLPEDSAAADSTSRGARRRARQARHRPPQALSATLVGVQPPDVIERPNDPLPTEVQNPGQSRGRGSNIHTLVDLTCQHKNQILLVEGPEITVRPVGTRRVTSGPQ